MRSRTHRLRVVPHQRRQQQRHPPRPALRQLPWAPIHHNHCIYPRSAMNPSQGSFDMHNSRGDTHLTLQDLLNTNTPQLPHTIICLLRGKGSRLCPSGLQLEVNTSRIRTVVAIKAFRSPAGIIHMALQEVINLYHTLGEMNGVLRSPRHPVSHMMHMVFAITPLNQCPAHLTHLLEVCQVLFQCQSE